jgi:hypothetical protein
VQPPTEKWRPPPLAHTSALAAGATATGTAAIAPAAISTAASFFISYSFADPARVQPMPPTDLRSPNPAIW